MTIHLYYEDSYLKEFSATVVGQCRINDRPAVVLDRTAFYPTSGGQPHDTGSLGPARVLAVEENEGGSILHVVDQLVPLGTALGRIDWERRFDHMQQHTGQHILSQAFLQTAGASTVSFHLGQETSTIDLELQDAASRAIEEAETLANRVVFEDRPVNILTAGREQLNALGVRKGSDREGPIRLVEIQDFDRSPCGGTHVRRSGEIGAIAILGCERYKGGTRVEFACGARTLRALHKDHEILKRLGMTFSAHPHELPRLTEKLLQERSALARENAGLQARICEMEAEELVIGADKSNSLLVIVRRYTDRSLDGLKLLSQKLVVRPGIVAVLGSSQQMDTAQVVVCKSRDVPGDCGATVKRISSRLGGRGGGTPQMAQAGGIPLSALEEWMQAAAKECSQHRLENR